MTTEFRVPDASCGHCKSTIETAVSSLADVSRAELDLDSKRLTVEHGIGVDPEQVKAAIESAGYTPQPAA